MGNLHTNLIVIFSVELGAAAIAAIVFGLTLLSYWNDMTNPGKRIRSILGSSMLACALVMGLSVFYLTETIRSEESTLKALFDDISLTRWIVYAAVYGAVAYALAKFYRMKETLQWTFIIGTAVSMGCLAIATDLGIDSATRRWTFFAFSLVSIGVALFVQLFADTFIDSTEQAESECERKTRGFVRLWVLITWALLYLWWFLGPYGGNFEGVGNLTFENSMYCAWDTVALWLPILIVYWSFSPIARDVRSSEAYGKARRAVSTMTRSRKAGDADVLVVHTLPHQH